MKTLLADNLNCHEPGNVSSYYFPVSLFGATDWQL